MSAPSDPVNFIPAEFFFQDVPSFKQTQSIVNVVSSDSIKKTDPLRYAAGITLQDASGTQSQCLVQFVTPQIWRIRYNPKFAALTDYSDVNSRIIVRDSFADLVDDLQEECNTSTAWNSPSTSAHWSWRTAFSEAAPGHWILSSIDYDAKTQPNGNGTVNTSLHFFQSPFRIFATRTLQSHTKEADTLRAVGIQPAEQIIWQTMPNAFRSQDNSSIDIINNVVLQMKKPGRAKYLGFGEQGRTVMNKPSFLNFFCYDNFNYEKVYKKGALDNREPLYHSTPFYLEMEGTPGFSNVTGVMVDSYSQVLMDLGKTHSGSIGVATRFGTFDAYIMTADNVPKMIWQYTSLVGRPKLKPRFVLGHHQGCYGYNSSQTVYDIVDGYRKNQIPLDGMHLDVDFQDRYRTFTWNGINFPDVKALFSNLKSQGVKCFTNITPILTIRESDSDQYQVLRRFWDYNDKLNPKTNLLVTDSRYKNGQQQDYTQCVKYDKSVDYRGLPQPTYKDPRNHSARTKFADYINAPVYTDDYNFYYDDSNLPGNYNSGYPYHGGVSYGENLGTPGFYPDLNRAAARELWGQQYKELMEAGLEAVWQDMTTPAVGDCYGDMLGFPSRLLLADDAYEQNPDVMPSKKTAIELWGLYSYNLHKATYHGIQKLECRKNKRNFIIGRGSTTGMHRFAGLWTGDNASTWDFWRISVAQVLALGYSGLTIAGADMGGFTYIPETNLPPPHWCDPELLIRWYSGAFLLPWYRNHYIQHFQSKEFQEPWQYTTAPDRYPNAQYPNAVIPDNIKWQYRSVADVCRYYVQLRYSLLQVMYDAMFGNLIHGLPIARAMLITDPDDTALFDEGADFVDNQYLLGYNILVCPIYTAGVSYRDVYLPSTNDWLASNLRVQSQGSAQDRYLFADTLDDFISGGSIVSYYCPVPDMTTPQGPTQLPFATPVYIRAGAIIPQIGVRQSITENDLNPPCIHFYPGADSEYNMFLDDGVSRDSAPADLPQYKFAKPIPHPPGLTNGDTQPDEAQSKYREVKLTQKYVSDQHERHISIEHVWDKYDPTPNIGSTYDLAIWSRKSQIPLDMHVVSRKFVNEHGDEVQDAGLSSDVDPTRGVVYTRIPTSLVSGGKLTLILRGWQG